MGDGQLASQARQPALVEHSADHPEILVEHQLLAVAHGQTGRFLTAMLEGEEAERRDGRGVGPPGSPSSACSPAGRTTPNTPHIAQPSQPRARPRPWSQACRRSRSADLDRIGDTAAALLGGPRRAGTAQLDDETVATDRADRLDRQTELSRQERQGSGISRPAADDEP